MGIFRLNKCDVFIGLYLLYMFQGTLYPQGVINQFIQLLMIVMAIIVAYPLLVPRLSHPKLLNATSLLVILYLVYGLIIIIGDHHYTFFNGKVSRPYVYLQTSLNSLLPIFFFFVCRRQNILTRERIKAYFFVFLGLAVFNYFKNYQAMLLEAMSKGLDSKEFTNNVGYSFVGLMAFVPLFRNFILRYSLLAFCFVFVMMGMKRGAILVGAVSIAYFLYRDFAITKETRRKFLITVGILFVVIGALFYVQKLYQESAYFRTRVELTKEGYSSGRDRIYASIWETYWKDTSVTHLLFGNGAHSTIGVAGNFAHQDWLETLYDTGLFGTAFLAYFFFVFFLMCRRAGRKISPQEVTSLWLLYLQTLSQTMFSMSIQSLSIPTTILLGFYTATINSSTLPKTTETLKLIRGA